MNFFEKCISKGINSIAAMQIEAKNQMSLLETEILSLDNEKSKKLEQFREIQNFLKQFELPKNTKVAITLTTKWEDLSDDLKFLCKEILEKVEKFNKISATKTTSEILDQAKRSNSINAIKWLYDQKILTRVDQDIIKGSSWDIKHKLIGELNND